MTRSPNRILFTGLMLAASLTLGLTGVYSQKAEPPKPAKEQTVMQRKLTHAQKILEGLAKADFDTMNKAADDLSVCVKEATWRINDTNKYILHSDQFLRDLDDLKKACGKKNIDAAALAYADMTRTCVKCHQHLRETGMGQ
jgi:cytochrome c556